MGQTFAPGAVVFLIRANRSLKTVLNLSKFNFFHFLRLLQIDKVLFFTESRWYSILYFVHFLLKLEDKTACLDAPNITMEYLACLVKLDYLLVDELENLSVIA